MRSRGYKAMLARARSLYRANFPCTYCGKKFDLDAAKLRGGSEVRGLVIVETGRPYEYQCLHCQAWIHINETENR